MDAMMQNGMVGGAINPYTGQPMNFSPNVVQMPTNVNALSDDEQKFIQQKPVSKLDINISQEDNLRSMCTHKSHGKDMVTPLNDGTGKVYCPICGEVWDPTPVSREQIDEAIELIYSAMQNSKWVGDFNIQLVREYFPISKMLEKFPDLYDYAMKTFNRYITVNGYQNANDANLYSQYNSLMGYNTANFYSNIPYQSQMPTYGQAPVQPQPMMATGQPAPMYGQAPVVNPMQIPTNTQFTDQSNMMMQGTYYGQPQPMMPAPQAAPMYGQAPMMGQPMQQPYQPQQPQAGTNSVTTTTKNDEEGNTTSESTVNLA